MNILHSDVFNVLITMLYQINNVFNTYQIVLTIFWMDHVLYVTIILFSLIRNVWEKFYIVSSMIETLIISVNIATKIISSKK